MSVLKRVLFFFILPVLGILSYEPSILEGAFSMLWVVVAIFAVLAYLLWRGYSRALTFMIFLMGLNVIVRLMILLSTSFNEESVFNMPFTIFGLVGAGISFYLMMRLDKVDVTQYMTK